MHYWLWWRRGWHLALWHCELQNIWKCSWHFLNGVFLHLSERSFNGLRCKYVSWKLLKHTLPLSKFVFFSRVFFFKNKQHVSKAFISVHIVLYNWWRKTLHPQQCHTVQKKISYIEEKRISLINSRRRLKPILLLPLCIVKQFLKCKQLMRLHA